MTSNPAASVRFINGLYDSVLALVYPKPCAVCRASVEARADGVACSACWAATRLMSDNDTLCWKCGALSLATITRDKRHQVCCGRCNDDSYTAARACGFYEGALRACVLELKREPRVASRLGGLMADAQRREPINRANLIVAVPLHRQRERERGFNQAALLASELARLTHLHFDDTSLIRRLDTERHRAGMDARARRDSVANAFAVPRAELVTEQSVLLVDDVFTTGATVSACAAALKQAGAKDVYVLTIARAQNLS